MSEFIDREKAIANIKAVYCCGCEHYNGVRCRACQIMDAMDVLEDEPAVVQDAQRWRKTSETPPTKEDAGKDGSFVLSVYYSEFYKKWRICQQTWELVVALQDEYPFWMPLPELPGERPKKLYWRERAGTTICPVCGYECNDDYYLDKFCPGCGTRLLFNEEGTEHDQSGM